MGFNEELMRPQEMDCTCLKKMKTGSIHKKSHLQQSRLQPYAAHTSFTNSQHAVRRGTIKENMKVIVRAMINFINRLSGACCD
jgi:hypothetical protein